MSTITTKQLRARMAQVVRDLQNGKSVQLSYRHKVIGVLQPINESPKALRRGSSGAISQFLNTNPFTSIPAELQASSMSFEQEVAELRDRDLA
jgi:antitoxin (DNA-binding transcriptional repressor) of toxin-antitoxin stability system